MLDGSSSSALAGAAHGLVVSVALEVSIALSTPVAPSSSWRGSMTRSQGVRALILGLVSSSKRQFVDCETIGSASSFGFTCLLDGA